MAKLERWLDKAVEGRKKKSHSGAARAAHDEAEARRLLQVGLKSLKLDEANLRMLPRNAPEKVALAWWLRSRTTVPLRWVAERLRMGHYTRDAGGKSNEPPPGTEAEATSQETDGPEQELRCDHTVTITRIVSFKFP